MHSEVIRIRCGIRAEVCKIDRSGGQLRPGVLHHILALITVHGIGDVTQKVVVVAVHGIAVDGDGIAVFPNDVLRTGVGQCFFRSLIRLRRLL